METTKAELLHWEVTQEPDDWQQRQFRAWSHDAKLRLQFPDFYRYLEGRRRHEVQEQKKRAVQQNHVTVKEATMKTSVALINYSRTVRY